MKYTVKDICCLLNCHQNTVYPAIKKLKPLILINSKKQYVKKFDYQQVIAILSYINKPKKEFVVPFIDNKLIQLATILNNSYS